MTVLGISGSLRRDSWNTKLLRAAAELLPPGTELEQWEGMRDVPPYCEDQHAEEGRPPAVEGLWRAVEQADALLIATPEYNRSLPGGLKSALDWLSRPLADSPLRGKPVAVVGASTGMFGAVWAQAETRKVLAAIGAAVLDRELPVMLAHERFDDAGRLSDADVRADLSGLVADLTGARQQSTAA